MTLYGEITVSWDEILQIRPVNPLKQLLKGCCFEVRQRQQHPLTGAQAHVGFRQRPGIAGKQHPPVLHANVFQIHPAQLVAGNALQPEQGGDGKFKIRHSSSVLIPLPWRKGIATPVTSVTGSP